VSNHLEYQVVKASASVKAREPSQLGRIVTHYVRTDSSDIWLWIDRNVLS